MTSFKFYNININFFEMALRCFKGFLLEKYFLGWYYANLKIF